jgi:hypothetical protein
MPNWFYPFFALIGIGGFIYFAFWKGLAIPTDSNNRDNYPSQSDDPSSGDAHHDS